jgi:hypothetical protein
MKQILFFLCAVAVCISSSCSKIYDNIKDFATEETVYVGKFDVAMARAGFERVELDLLKERQVLDQIILGEAGAVKLGKAKQTVVEYDSTVITYDSVMFSVNITGLTIPKMYRFHIYNIDEYGNKSIPIQATAIPYTQTDLDALVLASPVTLVSPSTAELSWPNGLSSTFFDFVGVTYSYNDRYGPQTHTTTETKLVLTDLVPGVQIPVQVICSIVPKINGNPILDTIEFDRSVTVSLIPPEEYLDGRVARSVTRVAITYNLAGTDANGYYFGLPNDFGTVDWGEASDHLVASEVRYTTKAGVETVSRMPASESRLECPDAKSGSTVETRSLFVPTGTSDTFATAWVLYEYPFMDEYQRYTWYSNDGIKTRNGYHPWNDGGGGISWQIVDNNLNSGWHSHTESPLPQCMVIDMKYSVHINHLTIYAPENQGWRYLQDIEVYLSDTPMDVDAETVPESSWGAPKARIVYDIAHRYENINLAPGSSGRYLALLFPTSVQGRYISFMELYAYGLPD